MKLLLSKETMRSLATKTGMRAGPLVPVNGSGLHCVPVFDGQISAATPCNPHPGRPGGDAGNNNGDY